MLLRSLLIFSCSAISSLALSAESVCYGTTKHGRIEHAVKLPASGPNFVSYSTVAAMLGRTYVHTTVRDIIVAAYKQLETEMPGKRFKYAETGHVKGGGFKPHKTHQNGLSVDFMVPVLNKKNESVLLPTNVLNRYGYDIEFDRRGHLENLRIDFESMAAHIVSLDKQARAHKVKLWRVIFDPELTPFLLKTRYAEYLKQHIRFSKKRSWVRHDEHYHVDFNIPCKSL
jgi:penicillin-insensitive murein endopeptidase